MVAKIALITYSLYGHIDKVATSVEQGLKETDVSVDRYQFGEILDETALKNLGAVAKPDFPVITPEKLAEYDGFLLGAGTRYGRLPAAVSAFFDRTGGLWAKGGLQGKLASMFTSTASQHGGQEVTHLTTVSFFAHHGILYVPTGYQATELFDTQNVTGGSAWGAGTITNGDGSRQPSEAELNIAKVQGKHFANVVKTFVGGKAALESQPKDNEKKEESKEAAPATAAAAAAAPAPVEKSDEQPKTEEKKDENKDGKKDENKDDKKDDGKKEEKKEGEDEGEGEKKDDGKVKKSLTKRIKNRISKVL